MSGRAQAAQASASRYHLGKAKEDHVLSEQYAEWVFSRSVMQKMLPSRVYHNLSAAMDGLGQIDPANADIIAEAMKEWAMSHGATHFTHWFQPLTGMAAEKHDAFIDWCGNDRMMERFTGKSLLQGEPDASSFPSGGLRSTYEARGHTGWDPSSPPFLWRGGDGMTLCIPSVFFSFTGEILDTKIPLLRSEHRLAHAVRRLLRHNGIKANGVHCTLGWEQEYFVVDRALRNLRPDLVMLGRTVFGAPSPKGQQLEDHYLGAVQDRILAYMQAFEEIALRLGIPVKTRHNEVAPGQHELAPTFERASLSVDHNLLVMELMRQVAVQHDLACLLHEKPFDGINGSGKHINWSLATDTGLNLLDPSDSPENSMPFLCLLAAILKGVYRHADLLRASIASAGNDYRLGANEAPPAIISVFLGTALEDLLDQIERKGSATSAARGESYDLGLPVIPHIPRENTDRNRTSPFAFTGNKFEYRACGSHASCAWPTAVLNIAVEEALSEMLQEIEEGMGDASGKEAFTQAAMPVLRAALKESRPIRFSGNNYSPEWEKEAEQRGLPHLRTSYEAFSALKTDKAAKLFKGVLSKSELHSRYEVAVDEYIKIVQIESALMIDLFRTQILPAAIQTQREMAQAIREVVACGAELTLESQRSALQRLSQEIEEATSQIDALARLAEEARTLEGDEQGSFYCKRVRPQGEAARLCVDRLEGWVDNALWPLPKYWELLFLK